MIFDPFLTPIKLNTGGRKVKIRQHAIIHTFIVCLMDAGVLLTAYAVAAGHINHMLLCAAIVLVAVSVLVLF